ncbi:MAG TPA: type VI secretion system tip protein TssI/VgrG [Gemmatimonadales bacterium]|nr:type VI secretion system tip protein TssI/VgrG [Gemmatimonadales bacterium]
MAAYSQANRPMKVDTALGPDVLLLEGFSGMEGVSTPFGYTMDLLSENAAIAPPDVLRKPAWLTIKTPDGGERIVHGLIRSFTQLGQSDGLTSYRSELVPWLWFLSLSSDCKIFQNLSVPEIVEQVFQGLGYSDFQTKLVKAYPKRLFCVQYRETHLNFVSRLLEEEGIFYFFEHSPNKHVLTLVDDNSAVKPCPGQAKARMAADIGKWQQEDVVTACECEDAVHTGKVTLRNYDPQQPSLLLESTVAGNHPEESYDYPGKYVALEEGDRYARLQLEAEEARQRVVRGAGTCRTFQSGYRFDLKEHYRKDANQGYMLLELRHEGRAGDYRSWESAPFDYRNDFVAIPYSVPYRPFQITPKPRIRGTQTALVVGKAGEEIWTDKDGRVKVQFYWDRLGKKDENSSCWIRVSQPWAGKGWGSLAVPRIGQEVIVEFLEGDPDLPIITGRVYNAEQTPPYNPGAGGVVSGLKSKTHKGSGYNEMSMDDTTGKEKVTIHGQFDMGTRVEHDKTESIGNDETIDIGNDRTETVGGNEALSVAKDRNRAVSGNEMVTVSLTRTHTVGINEAITVGAAQEVSVGAMRALTVGANQTTTIGINHTESVGSNHSEDIGSNHSATVGSNRQVQIGKDDKLQVGKTLTIQVADQITISTGKSSITMKKDGTITIQGKDITIKGTGEIAATASKDMTLKGKKILQN